MRTSTLALVVAPAAVLGQSPLYGQCGGQGWGGSTSCVSGSVCNKINDYYSQCVPGTGGGNGGGSGNVPTTTAGNSNPAPTGGSGAAGGLNDKFKAKGKIYYGTEIDHYHLNNAPLTTIVKNSFGQVTPENSMKWDATERKYLFLPNRPSLMNAH